jgi:hypothetical protein
LDGNSLERVARSCRSINYHPTFVGITLTILPGLEKNADLDGALVGMTVMPKETTSNPAIGVFLQALQRYAPGQAPGTNVEMGWIAAQIFGYAGRSLPDSPSSQSILDGLWQIKDNDFGGITHPITYVKDQNPPQTFCYFETQMVHGQFVSPNGGARTCQPAAVSGN